MINPLKQAPLDSYFISPNISHIPYQGKRHSPRIHGVGKFVKYFEASKEENGLFISKAAKEEDLRNVFTRYGAIRDIRIFGRYAFVLFENNIDTSSITERHHDIGGVSIYVDKIKGQSPYFVPRRSRKKANMWHRHKDKFVRGNGHR